MRQREWKKLFIGYMTNGIKTETDNGWNMESYIGSVFSLMPSGKYCMPWSSNVTEKVSIQDERERERMEKAANELGAWVESGEGDPTDLFLCWPCPEFQTTDGMKECIENMDCLRFLFPVSEQDEQYRQQVYQSYLEQLIERIGLYD